MTPGYRLIQFVPDPFLPTALTIGAFVESHEGCRFELAEAGEGVLSSSTSAAATTLFRAVVAELRNLDSGRLPLSLGPHVRMGERVPLPAGVSDAASWVTSFVLPAQASVQKRERRHQRTRRATVGKLFFKQYHVSQFVKTRFRPEMLGASQRLVKPVTHYVRGTLETMLLEPVYLDSDRFDEELQEAAGTLLAWETLARKTTENLVFTVYALGSSAQHLKLLRDGVGDTRIQVVDTEHSTERAALLQSIRVASLARQLHG